MKNTYTVLLLETRKKERKWKNNIKVDFEHIGSWDVNCIRPQHCRVFVTMHVSIKCFQRRAFWPANTSVFSQLSYSPDLISRDRFILPKLKLYLKRLHFELHADIQGDMTVLKGISENDFQQYFH
jgi:hypothetical protein